MPKRPHIRLKIKKVVTSRRHSAYIYDVEDLTGGAAMRNGRKPKNVRNLTIRPAWMDEFFQDSDGQRHRGMMVAFDKEGNEVARGTTYAEFMVNLHNSEQRVSS
jgi:hypothetical protein